jgi:flagellar protein FlgJ
MNPAMLQTDVYTDIQGLSRLRAQAKNNGEQALREVAGQFEALFIQMMLKSMRDANLAQGLLDSQHSRTYQSMYDKQIAIELSRQQGLGLADMMVRQLSRSNGIESGTGAEAAAPGSAQANIPVNSVNAAEGGKDGSQNPGVSAVESVKERGPGGIAPDWQPDSAETFIRELWPHAQRTARELGTRPELLLAQTALETGWGKHMIRGADGRNSLNLFGIKADAGWQGERAVTETIEFEDGLMRKQRASFRAYDSLADSFADYANFLKTNPRYREALNRAADAPAFARALAQAGYATDPDYSVKINRIMGGERLRDALSGVKDSAAQPLS